MGQCYRRIIKVARDVFSILSGDNISGLLSSTLDQKEIMHVNPIKNMFDEIKLYLNDEDTVKTNILQIVSPHLKYSTLMDYCIQIGKPLYDYSRQLFQKNRGINLKPSEARKGPPSKFNDPAIRKHIHDFAWNFSDFLHQNVLKKESRKCGHDVCRSKDSCIFT